MSSVVCDDCGEEFDKERQLYGHKHVHNGDKTTDEELLKELRRLRERTEGDLKTTDMRQEGRFSVGIYQSRFGSWSNALEKIGEEVSVERDLSDERLLEELKQFADRLGRTPTVQEMDERGPFHSSAYIKRFGRWNGALAEANLRKNVNTRFSEDDLLSSLQELRDDIDRVPRAKDITEHLTYGVNTFIRHFGSFKVALEKAGFELVKDSVEYQCDYCGNESTQPRSRFESNENHFCSNQCYKDYRESLDTGEHLLSDRVSVDCDNCGKALLRKAHRSKSEERSFCDPTCLAEFRSEQTGEQAHAWKGGHEPYYGPNWNEQRRKARARDDYTCQSCGVHEDNYERELSVHHIKPLRTFGNEDGGVDFEAANDLQNLVSLCGPCHRDWEGIPVRPALAN